MEIQESTGITPKALENRPTIHPWLSFYVNSFYELSRSRKYAGMGSPISIPMSEIKDYAEYFEITGLEAKTKFFKYISRMDDAYLEMSQQAQENKDKSTKT